MVTSACFYIFFPYSSLVNVKCILLNFTCVFLEGFYFCILVRSQSFSVETHVEAKTIEVKQLIYNAGWLLDFYVI